MHFFFDDDEVMLFLNTQLFTLLKPNDKTVSSRPEEIFVGLNRTGVFLHFWLHNLCTATKLFNCSTLQYEGVIVNSCADFNTDKVKSSSTIILNLPN